MKKIVWLVMVLQLVFAGSVFAGDYMLKVTADGDYQNVNWLHAGQYDHWTENTFRNEAYFGSSVAGGNVYILRKDTIMNLSLPIFATGETIEQASFYYYPLASNQSINSVSLYRGDSFIPNVFTATNRWIGTDVTSYLKSDQDAGTADLQFSIRSTGAISSMPGFDYQLLFASGADQDYAPYLQLRTSGGQVTTPEPATMILFGIGGIATALLKRKKKHS